MCGYAGVWVFWNTRPLSHTSLPQPSSPVDDKTQPRWVTAGYLRASHKWEAAPWRPRGESLEPHRLTRAFYTPDKATFESRASWPSPPSHRRCPQPRTEQHQTRVGPSPFVCFEAGAWPQIPCVALGGTELLIFPKPLSLGCWGAGGLGMEPGHCACQASTANDYMPRWDLLRGWARAEGQSFLPPCLGELGTALSTVTTTGSCSTTSVLPVIFISFSF